MCTSLLPRHVFWPVARTAKPCDAMRCRATKLFGKMVEKLYTAVLDVIFKKLIPAITKFVNGINLTIEPYKASDMMKASLDMLMQSIATLSKPGGTAKLLKSLNEHIEKCKVARTPASPPTHKHASTHAYAPKRCACSPASPPARPPARPPAYLTDRPTPRSSACAPISMYTHLPSHPLAVLPTCTRTYMHTRLNTHAHT